MCSHHNLVISTFWYRVLFCLVWLSYRRLKSFENLNSSLPGDYSSIGAKYRKNASVSRCITNVFLARWRATDTDLTLISSPNFDIIRQILASLLLCSLQIYFTRKRTKRATMTATTPSTKGAHSPTIRLRKSPTKEHLKGANHNYDEENTHATQNEKTKGKRSRHSLQFSVGQAVVLAALCASFAAVLTALSSVYFLSDDIASFLNREQQQLATRTSAVRTGQHSKMNAETKRALESPDSLAKIPLKANKNSSVCPKIAWLMSFPNRQGHYFRCLM
jgi:hypothetical protein